MPPSSAALVMSASALTFAVMAAVAKLAAARIPGPEVALIRFALGTLACGAWHLREPLAPRNRGGLLARGLFGGAAVLCYFTSIEHLPVGIATLLNYTAPAFTAVWAAIFLRERVDGRTAAALLLTLLGVALLVLGQAPPGAAVRDRWELVGVLGAVLSGAAIATVRELRRTDGHWEIFTAFNVGGIALTLVPSLRGWVWPAGRELPLLLAVAVLSVTAQLGMTWSLRWLRAATGGLLMQITPVAALALGALAFGDRIRPLALLGAAIVLVGVSFGAWLSGRLHDEPEVPEDA